MKIKKRNGPIINRYQILLNNIDVLADYARTVFIYVIYLCTEDAITMLEKIMTKKLEEVQQTLKVSLLAEVTKNKKQFEEKMKGMIKENKSYAETVKNSQATMNATPQSTNTTDLRSIIREEQNEQLAEESDKKMRSCNLILHGVRESITDDKNQAKQRDK